MLSAHVYRILSFYICLDLAPYVEKPYLKLLEVKFYMYVKTTLYWGARYVYY